MDKLLVVFLVIFFLLTNISALCEEGQIDINIALEEELIGIKHIGDKRANEIIELRAEKLFNSVDDLVRVSGINGEGKHLEEIKNQGLACVNGQEEEDEKEDKETTKEEEVNEEGQEIEEPLSRETGPIELQKINLNPKVIKGEDDNENLSKSNYAIYGLVFFCILLVVLFTLRKNRYNKNEFRQDKS